MPRFTNKSTLVTYFHTDAHQKYFRRLDGLMPLWGCIADDYTGATDLATNFVSQGFRTVVVFGTPGAARRGSSCVRDRRVPRSMVVALKSRTAPAAEAVAWSREAARWLTGAGASRLLFKYCSTFDSTDAGNIGPVAEALRVDLGTTGVAHCPAYPANGRTVYQGHLFVGAQLLSASPMRHHPLTPMTDADLVAVLGRQLPPEAGPVGRVVLRTVTDGPDAVRRAVDGATTTASWTPSTRTTCAPWPPPPPTTRCAAGGAGPARSAAPGAALGGPVPGASRGRAGRGAVGSQSAATRAPGRPGAGHLPCRSTGPPAGGRRPGRRGTRLSRRPRANLGPVPVVVVGRRQRGRRAGPSGRDPGRPAGGGGPRAHGGRPGRRRRGRRARGRRREPGRVVGALGIACVAAGPRPRGGLGRRRGRGPRRPPAVLQVGQLRRRIDVHDRVEVLG